MTRPELASQVAVLRAERLIYRVIAERLGISTSYAAELATDPEGVKARERKDSYRRPCVDCGVLTNGADGPREEPRCLKCASVKAGADRKVWTREAILAALREWAVVYGEPPAECDWSPGLARHKLHDEERARRWEKADGHWPGTSTVFREFDGWNNAIRAAGLTPRAAHGGAGNQYRQRSRRKVAA